MANKTTEDTLYEKFLDCIIIPIVENNKVVNDSCFVGVAFTLIADYMDIPTRQIISMGVLLTGLCMMIISRKVKEDGFFVGFITAIIWLLIFGESYKAWLILMAVSLILLVTKDLPNDSDVQKP